MKLLKRKLFLHRKKITNFSISNYNSYLNKDQKEKYKILTEKMKSGKKIKKGKKEEVKDEIKEDKTTEEKL